MEFGAKKSNSGRIGTQIDRFGVGGWEKVHHKDRVQSSEGQKRIKTAAHFVYHPT